MTTHNRPIRATLVATGVGAFVLGVVGIANAATGDPSPTFTMTGSTYVDNGNDGPSYCEFDFTWVNAVPNVTSVAFYDPATEADPSQTIVLDSASGSMNPPWITNSSTIAVSVDGGKRVTYTEPLCGAVVDPTPSATPTDSPVATTPPADPTPTAAPTTPPVVVTPPTSPKTPVVVAKKPPTSTSGAGTNG